MPEHDAVKQVLENHSHANLIAKYAIEIAIGALATIVMLFKWHGSRIINDIESIKAEAVSRAELESCQTQVIALIDMRITPLVTAVSELTRRFDTHLDTRYK